MNIAIFTLAVVLSLLGGYLFLTTIVHRAYRAPRIAESGSPADLELPYHTVYIRTENGKQLFAWYIPPVVGDSAAPGVVALHGWGGNSEFMLPFALWLHRAGFATLLLDARNHGSSDTDTFSSLPRFTEDLEHGFDWLAAKSEVDPQRIALLGHSVGAGAALLLASRRHDDVAAVVSIAAFAHPEELMRRQMQSHRIPYIPIGWAVMRYIERTIGSRYEAIAPINTIRNVSCPVLLVHGCDDRRIPVADARAIYAQRSHDRVELLILPKAAHSSIEDMESLRDELIGFLERAFTAWDIE